MQFKEHFTYEVGKHVSLCEIFPTGILPNGFINKGRCAIGGTYMEIMNKERCAIVTVPNISILISKKEQHPEIDIVFGDVSQYEVDEYLRDFKKGQKIFTTPEGFEKILKAAHKWGRTKELQREWFLMLDEAHSFISEDYRPNILFPFQHFFEFENKCVISATPYFFSHPQMKELDYHEVIITDKIEEVTLVDCRSVGATLDMLLKRVDELPGNLHIFFNSVTEIARAVRKANQQDCNIFCAEDRGNKNLTTLGDLAKFSQEYPTSENFKKINFYTSKYFEGWDMYDLDATLVVVTDIHKPHTKIGVADKALQAFGRLRGTKGTTELAKPHMLIHLTNHLHTQSMKHTDIINADYTYQARTFIDRHNADIADPSITQLILDDRLKRFARIDKDTKQASLDPFKLDQVVNEAMKTEVYNHISYVQDAWQNKFDVIKQQSELVSETKTAQARKSASKQFEEDFDLLVESKNKRNAEGTIIFDLGVGIENIIKDRNNLAYRAFLILDEENVRNLKGNRKKVEQELIIKENELAEVKLLKLLSLHFKVGKSYKNSYIIMTLQKLYDKLKLKTKAGKIMVAEPSHLGKDGRFEIKNTKINNTDGSYEHGYTILRKQFGLVTIH